MNHFKIKLPIVAKATLPTKAAFAITDPPSPAQIVSRLHYAMLH